MSHREILEVVQANATSMSSHRLVLFLHFPFHSVRFGLYSYICWGSFGVSRRSNTGAEKSNVFLTSISFSEAGWVAMALRYLYLYFGQPRYVLAGLSKIVVCIHRKH